MEVIKSFLKILKNNLHVPDFELLTQFRENN